MACFNSSIRRFSHQCTLYTKADVQGASTLTLDNVYHPSISCHALTPQQKTAITLCALGILGLIGTAVILSCTNTIPHSVYCVMIGIAGGGVVGLIGYSLFHYVKFVNYVGRFLAFCSQEKLLPFEQIEHYQKSATASRDFEGNEVYYTFRQKNGNQFYIEFYHIAPQNPVL